MYIQRNIFVVVSEQIGRYATETLRPASARHRLVSIRMIQFQQAIHVWSRLLHAWVGLEALVFRLLPWTSQSASKSAASDPISSEAYAAVVAALLV